MLRALAPGLPAARGWPEGALAGPLDPPALPDRIAEPAPPSGIGNSDRGQGRRRPEVGSKRWTKPGSARTVRRSPGRGGVLPGRRTTNSARCRRAGGRGRRRRRRGARRPATSTGMAPAASDGARCSGRMPTRTGVPSAPGAGATGRAGRQRRHAAADGGGDEVHRRGADEAGDEDGGRALVDRERGVDLLGAAFVHHDQPVGEGHRLDLVVGDVEGGGADLALQGLDLQAHLHAELGVEVGERLVEQEGGGAADQRPAHGDALALAAGELARAAGEVGGELEHGGGRLDAGAAGRRRGCRRCAGRRPCCRRRSCAGRARSSGTPWRCRGRAARGRSPRGRRWRWCRR